MGEVTPALTSAMSWEEPLRRTVVAFSARTGPFLLTGHVICFSRLGVTSRITFWNANYRPEFGIRLNASPFNPAEVTHIRELFQHWVAEQGHAGQVAWDQPEGQPYCIYALELLSRLTGDSDTPLWSFHWI